MIDPSPELFVAKGLFPENLPPVFTTKNVWQVLAPDAEAYSITAKAVGAPSPYSASKRGGLRRLFGVPHPQFIKDQGIFFRKHWTDLQALLDGAAGSSSRPIFDDVGPRHVRITPHRDLPKLRLKRLSRFKYCLVTDVARFYPSVYTHSLPWAINGKAAAKADNQSNSSAIFGNKLDFIIRQAQSRQTIGIPVGPDVSKISAEIVMSAVDKRFISLSGKNAPVYVRHVDDYWIGGNTHDECEKHLQNLRLALKDFELDINETKTRIISTKFVFGESWPSEFEKEIRDSLGVAGGFYGIDPMSTLGKIVDRATRENDDGIIKHTIRIIDERRLWTSNWEILEHFLAQCAVQFPHSFDYVARVIAWRVRTAKKIDKELWIEIARLTASQNARLGHDSEVVWAIWLMKELNQRLTKAVSDVIISNSGSLVLAFLAHFPKNKLAGDKSLYSKLRDLVDGDPFAGTYWPLTLELVHLAEGGAAWHSGSTVSSLRVLHDAKISLIDWSAAPKVFAEVESEDEATEPDYAIEDYGSDYAEDDEDEDDEEKGRDLNIDWDKLVL